MTNAGGQGEGLDPAKTLSFDPATDLQQGPFNTGVSEVDLRPGGEPASNVCPDCVVTSVTVLPNNGTVDEIWEIGEIGGTTPLCRIYLLDGEVVMDECHWTDAPGN